VKVGGHGADWGGRNAAARRGGVATATGGCGTQGGDVAVADDALGVSCGTRRGDVAVAL
jgi:hypothetical protein